jgi:hypothetical protein
VLEPAACKTCAAERCCAPITKCHGASIADGGQTACELFGACDVACNGDPVCGLKCELMYGEQNAMDWYASDGCLSAGSPSGCKDFCF